MDKTIFKEGMLTKLGGSGIPKKWQERWFVLEQYELSYYKKQEDAEDKPAAGIVNISEVVDIRENLEADRPFCFEIELPTRTYQLVANDQDEMTEWLEVLRDSKKDAPPPPEPIDDRYDDIIDSQEEAALVQRFKEDMSIQSNIRSLLEDLKLPPESDEGKQYTTPESKDKEGKMWKMHNSINKWKKYYVVLSGRVLYRYVGEEQSQTIKTVMPVNYIRLEDVSETDQLLRKQMKSFDQPTSRRIVLYSTKKIYKMSADDDLQATSWVDAMVAGMKKEFTEQEWAVKEKAARELEPLLKEQLDLEIAHSKMLLDVLEEAGLAPGRIKRDKVARLKMRINNLKGSWSPHTVMLMDNCIYYYDRETDPSETVPAGCVPLKYCTIEWGPPEVHQTNRQRIFKVQSPLRQYYFKAKHDVAAEEWVGALEKNKYGRDRGWFAKRGHDKSGPASVYANISPGSINAGPQQSAKSSMTDKVWQLRVVQYKTGPISDGKAYQLKDGITTVGRGSDQGIVLPQDPKISRDQMKLEVDGAYVTLADLGSRRGTKVNNEKFIKGTIFEGDRITVGETTLIIELAAPKKRLLSKFFK